MIKVHLIARLITKNDTTRNKIDRGHITKLILIAALRPKSKVFLEKMIPFEKIAVNIRMATVYLK